MTSPRNATLHVLIGPVGAGKTTFGQRRAATEGAVFLDLDAWMVRLYGDDKRPSEGVLGWYLERRERVRSVAWSLTLDVLRAGTDVWLEFGLLAAEERRQFYERAQSEDVAFRVYLLDAPRDVRRQRVMERNRAGKPFTQAVPLEFFERASDAWQPPSAQESASWALVEVPGFR